MEKYVFPQFSVAGKADAAETLTISKCIITDFKIGCIVDTSDDFKIRQIIECILSDISNTLIKEHSFNFSTILLIPWCRRSGVSIGISVIKIIHPARSVNVQGCTVNRPSKIVTAI